MGPLKIILTLREWRCGVEKLRSKVDRSSVENEVWLEDDVWSQISEHLQASLRRRLRKWANCGKNSPLRILGVKPYGEDEIQDQRVPYTRYAEWSRHYPDEVTYLHTGNDPADPNLVDNMYECEVALISRLSWLS